MEGEQYSANLQSGLDARVICIEACFGKIAPAILEEETESMPSAPQNKVECHAMPQADDQHRRELTDENHRPCGDGFIAANPAIEGIKEIRADPLREGHVPTVPELG